jgi:hypothetical protein
MATHDPEFYEAPKFAAESYEPPRQRGCFFYGCIIASILAVLMVVAIGVGAFLFYRFLGRVVEEYTATAPRELPKVEMPAEQRQAVKQRFEAFRKAATEGKATEPLVLTSDDLNALIEENPELKGKIYVTIEGDKLKGQISIPLEKIGIGMLRGRYLNGEAELKASLSDGVLIVTLDSIEVNGKRPPENFLEQMRQQNLAKDAYKDPQNAEMIRKFESLEIKDGKITIKLRGKPGTPSGAPATKKEIPVEVFAPPPENDQPKSKSEPPKAKAEPSPGGETAKQP